MKAKTASFALICLLLVAGLVLPLFPHGTSLRAMPVPQSPGNVYCASDDGHRNYCQADVRGGVQLYKQRSEAACVFGQTWGYERRGIWVDRGCRAEFAIGFTGGPGNWVGWGENYNVYCASDDGHRNRCPVDTRGGVRLARQRSGSVYCRGCGKAWLEPPETRPLADPPVDQPSGCACTCRDGDRHYEDWVADPWVCCCGMIAPEGEFRVFPHDDCDGGRPLTLEDAARRGR